MTLQERLTSIQAQLEAVELELVEFDEACQEAKNNHHMTEEVTDSIRHARFTVKDMIGDY